MKVDLDARTLEAMRKIAGIAYYTAEQNGWRDDIRAFLAQHDAALDAERDEELALKLRTLYLSFGPDAGRDAWREVARAARAHIAKEQVNTQQPRMENCNG